MAVLRERDSELRSIAESLRSARAGEGRLVVVEGEAGMGKTSLLTATRQLAAEAGMRVLTARAAELEQDFPFGIVHQLLDVAVATAEHEHRERWYAGAGGLARGVLSEPRSVAVQGAELYPLLHGLNWLVNAMAREQPVLLVVDDAQWADAPSLAFLDFLARRLDGLPLLLVVAGRPLGQRPRAEVAQILGQTGALRLRPRPLTHAAVGAWLSEDLADTADHEFVARCAEITRGNPLYLQALIHDLAQDGVSPTRSAVESLATSAPDGVAASVAQRLALVDASARSVVDAVAVLGDGATVELVARLADLPDARPAFDALAATGLLLGELPPTFAHPVVRTTAYSALQLFERERLHRRAASLLEEEGASVDLVAAHLLQTTPGGDARTVDLLRRAATSASGVGAASTAVVFLRRALDEPPTEGVLPAVLLELGRAMSRAGDPEAEEVLQRALTLTRDESERVATGIELARVQNLTGRALASAQVLQSLSSTSSEVELELLTLAYAGVAARAHLAAWRAGLDEPERGASEHDLVRVACQAFDLATSTGPRDEAVASARWVASRRPLPAGVTGATYAVLLAGVSLLWCDELEDATGLAGEVLDHAREGGHPLAVAVAVQQTGLAARVRGDLAGADADAREAIELGTLFPTLTVLAVAHSTILLSAVERGVADDELRTLDRDVEEARLDNDALPHVEVHHARGVVAAAVGDLPSARQHLEAAGRHAESWGAHNPSVSPWRSDLARVLLAQGEGGAARRLAGEEVDLARTLSGQRGLGVALTGAAAVADDASSALRLLEEATGVLETSGARLAHARALVELGRTLRRAGRTSSARDSLWQGRELAVRCGAHRLADLALQELLASGARPRRLAVSGVDALTPSERRVSELAARGLTNRLIAQQLFVSERTVENHLSRSFDKLGVRSRVQLGALMAAS